MIKAILGLVACAGLALGGLYIYSGAIDGTLPGGSCCHKPVAAVTADGECCMAATEAVAGCCASPSRTAAISTGAKTACCEAAEGSVEVLTVLPREVAAR